MRKVLTALVVLGIVVPSAAAAAQATGAETFNAVIVASTTSGTRTVLASTVIARGVFNGVGRIVETDNLPGDPDNVLRDDLVFRDGTMHLRSAVVDFSISINPRSCVATVKITQEGTIEGGTGRFAGATGTFDGTLNGIVLAGRNPDGSCNQEAPPVSEVDFITSTGTMSF
jgi:hypothetical protein